MKKGYILENKSWIQQYKEVQLFPNTADLVIKAKGVLFY